MNRPPAAQISHTVPEAEWVQSFTLMMNRISDLEQNCQYLKTQLVTPRESDRSHSPRPRSRLPSSSQFNEPVIPVDERFRGPTNMLEPIRILVAKLDCTQDVPEFEVPPEHCATNNWDWHDSATERVSGLDILDREARIDDIAQLNSTVDLYFTKINPMFPCLNENQFRAQMQDALETGASGMDRPNRYQFFALLHLIQAEVLILIQDWKPADPIPGWKGNGNLLTIQCFIVKARYFLYLERGGAAHETITRAVHLCFQLGLHDSASWGHCSAFEKVIRQRVFWTVFQLERSMALNNGYPYLIREAEINVDFPPCENDQEHLADGETESKVDINSYGQSILITAKWGSLVSEIWDDMFAAKTRKTMSREYIAGMDARVTHIMNNLPPCLKAGSSDSKLSCTLHSAIIQLRFNQLRLLLQQNSLLSFDYDEQVAAKCLIIIRDVLRIVKSLIDSPNRDCARFIAIFHIVVTQIPLVSLITHPKNSLETRAEAASCFKTEVSLLHGLAPTFAMARHVLQRLRLLITSVKATMKEITSPAIRDCLIGASSPLALHAHSPLPSSQMDYDANIDLDTTAIDRILSDSLLAQTETAFHQNDLASLWPDDVLSYPWAMPTGAVQ
ncbi:hypothetical protein N7454_007548 [Penicillium verhagenii]|nr:hypothetical protein N7454_007548 [Penicillium verhagenii]